MKDFTLFGIIIGTLVIVGIGIGEHIYMKNISNDLINDIEKAEIEIENNIENGRSLVKNIIKKWNEREKVLEVIVNHDDVRKISIELIKINSKLEKNYDCYDVSTNFALLKEYINNIENNNSFTVNNIL